MTITQPQRQMNGGILHRRQHKYRAVKTGITPFTEFSLPSIGRSHHHCHSQAVEGTIFGHLFTVHDVHDWTGVDRIKITT